MKVNIFVIVILLAVVPSTAWCRDALHECWAKQVKPLKEQYLQLTCREDDNMLYHSSEPWQTYNRKSTAQIDVNAACFQKVDTIIEGKNAYTAKILLDNTSLLSMDFGDTSLSPVTKADYEDMQLKTASYTPVYLINYFVQHKAPEVTSTDKELTVYKLTIDKEIVKLYISNTGLLHKATMFSNDDLRGDVLRTITYLDYSNDKLVPIPMHITIDKTNGKAKDDVVITAANVISNVSPVLKKPIDFAFSEEKTKTQEIVSTEKYSDHIHLVTFKNAESLAMIIEFTDYLVVAEAPLNSENGEALIKEARKIAPQKPIKYFAFGHHHPWYLGGMRAFIHKDVTVLTVPSDTAYLNFLATAPHTLAPDSLQMQPHKLQVKQIQDSIAITDGSYTMNIYVLGKKSEHTNDYLVYYFPTEKMMFEDDLAYFTKAGPVRKANKRQAGLYTMVKDMKLDVGTVVQSWPVNDKVKYIIPFSDFEQSMSMK